MLPIASEVKTIWRCKFKSTFRTRRILNQHSLYPLSTEIFLSGQTDSTYAGNVKDNSLSKNEVYREQYYQSRGAILRHSPQSTDMGVSMNL